MLWQPRHFTAHRTESHCTGSRVAFGRCRPDLSGRVARARNFTLPMEGATTAEAIAEKRAAEFEAAEAARLQVRVRCSVRVRYRVWFRRVAEASHYRCRRAAGVWLAQHKCLALGHPLSGYSVQAMFKSRLEQSVC